MGESSYVGNPTVPIISPPTVLLSVVFRTQIRIKKSPFTSRTIAKISKEDVVEEVFGRMWWCAMLLV